MTRPPVNLGSGRFTGVGALLAVLGIAAVLRLYGLRWGLPGALHSYSYHPDEFLSVNAAFRVYHTRSFDPGIYVYPSLYMYLSALAMAVGFGYGAAPTLGFIYLAARVMTVVMGVAGAAVTWWAGRVLFGGAVGLAAALIVCIAPLHVQHSHYATVDVPSTLFVAAALAFAGLVMKRGLLRDYAGAGAMAGLAAGTKYNAGLALLAVAGAHLLRGEAQNGRWRRLLVAPVCAVGAFVISTPGSIFKYWAFKTDFLYELSHVSTGHGLVFAGTGSGLVYNFVSSLWYGLGPALAVAFAASVVWAVVRREMGAMVVLAFAVPYYVLISLSHVRFARYTLPLYPAAAVLIGWMVADWYLLSARRKLVGLKVTLTVCAAAVLLTTLWYTVGLIAAFGRTDPRDQAARWVFAHVPRGSRIGVMEVPWFYSPPLSKMLGYGRLSDREEAVRDAPYELVVFRWRREQGYEWFEILPPNWVIISDYETEDALRLLGNRHIGSTQRDEVRRIAADLELVETRYRRAARFGGGRFSSLPHDMRYPLPTITIYELRT